MSCVAYVQWMYVMVYLYDGIRTKTLIACASHFIMNITNKTGRKKSTCFLQEGQIHHSRYMHAKVHCVSSQAGVSFKLYQV